ncbi:MAG: hypothetical protein ACXWKC_03780 [Xanthobacteraceae bacterium]
MAVIASEAKQSHSENVRREIASSRVALLAIASSLAAAPYQRLMLPIGNGAAFVIAIRLVQSAKVIGTSTAVDEIP